MDELSLWLRKEPFMNKAVMIGLVALLPVLGGVGGWRFASRHSNQRLQQHLAESQRLLNAKDAALARNAQALATLESKVSQMTLVLTNSTAHLEAAQRRVQELTAQLALAVTPPAPSVAPSPKEGQPRHPAPAFAPTIRWTTNDLGKAEAVSVFATLYDKNGRGLGEQLEYSGVYGRRVAFRALSSGQRMAFDVDDLHPDVLLALGINASTQKDQDARQQRLWKQVQAIQLAAAAPAEEARRAKLAAEAAVRAEAQREMAAEAQRQWERDMQAMSVENDRARADAALRAADAAMLNALNPNPDIIINNHVPPRPGGY